MKRIAGLVSVAGLVFTIACGQTDAGITTAVKSKLAADDAVKAYQIDVDTDNHVVTLTGEVTGAARERAVMLARDTDGVRDVIDRLQVDAAAGSGVDVDVDAPDLDRQVDIDVDDDLERNTREGVNRAESGAREGANRVESGAREGSEAVAEGARRGTNAVAEGARRGTNAVVEGAKKGAEAVADGAKKVGSEVKEAVTDDDRDSDKDGR